MQGGQGAQGQYDDNSSDMEGSGSEFGQQMDMDPQEGQEFDENMEFDELADGSMEDEDRNGLKNQLKDHHGEEEVLDQIQPGAARALMFKLANGIAETTPAIIDRESRKKMLILEQVRKQGEKKGQKRIAQEIMEETQKMQRTQQEFLQANRKKTEGLTLNKDIRLPTQTDEVYDECGVDYQSKYEDNLALFEEQVVQTHNFRNVMLKKQEDYIFREQEYRNTIKILENQIEAISLHPLRQPEKKTTDQTTLEQIKSRLNLNESDSESMDSGSDDDGFVKAKVAKNKKMDGGGEQNNPKYVNLINNQMADLEKDITGFQEKTQIAMRNRRDQCWKEYDGQIETLRKQLQEAKKEQMDNKTDFKENEKKLQEKLETMTSMAEKIDEDNRQLIKINNDLRIQYYAQTGDPSKSIKGDREILLKSILNAKKKGSNLQDKHRDLKLQCEEIEKTNAQTDAMLSNNHFGPGGRMTATTQQKTAYGNQSAMSKETSNNMLHMRQQVNKGRTGTAPKADMFNRPHTAAMLFPVAGAARPYTGNQAGYFNKTRGTGAPNQTSNGNLLRGFQGNQGSGRAVSAGFVKNPKLARYEDLINRLKKLLEQEKKNLRVVRTMCASEIDNRNYLERVLRQCVTDVQDEIARKRSQNTSNFYGKGKRGQNELMEEKNLSRMEKEKIIEVLLSQERVLTLLYDKTFPPNPSNKNRAAGGAAGLASALKPQTSSMYGMQGPGNSMLQFNYHGQPTNEEQTFNVDEEDAADLVALEAEVEQAVRCGTASAPRRGQNKDPNIVNMHANSGFRSSHQRKQMASTAVGGKRSRLPPQPQRKRLQSTNQARPTGGFGGSRGDTGIYQM